MFMIGSHQGISEACEDDIEMKDVQLAYYNNKLCDVSDTTENEAPDISLKDLLSFSWQIAKGMVRVLLQPWKNTVETNSKRFNFLHKKHRRNASPISSVVVVSIA